MNKVKDVGISWQSVFRKYAKLEQSRIVKYNKDRLQFVIEKVEEEKLNNLKIDKRWPSSTYQKEHAELINQINDPMLDPYFSFLEDVFISDSPTTTKELSEKYDVNRDSIRARIKNTSDRYVRLHLKTLGIEIPSDLVRVLLKRAKF